MPVKKNVSERGTDAFPGLFDGTEDTLMVEGWRYLYQEEKEILAKELSVKKSLKKECILKLLSDNPQDLNFEQIEGNDTRNVLFSAYSKMIEKYGYEPLDFGKPTDKIIEQLQVIFTDLGWNTDLLFVDLNKEGKDLEKQPYFKTLAFIIFI